MIDILPYDRANYSLDETPAKWAIRASKALQALDRSDRGKQIANARVQLDKDEARLRQQLSDLKRARHRLDTIETDVDRVRTWNGVPIDWQPGEIIEIAGDHTIPSTTIPPGVTLSGGTIRRAEPVDQAHRWARTLIIDYNDPSTETTVMEGVCFRAKPAGENLDQAHLVMIGHRDRSVRHRVEIRRCHFYGAAADGLYLGAVDGVVSHCTSRYCARAGISATGPSFLTFEHCRLDHLNIEPEGLPPTRSMWTVRQCEVGSLGFGVRVADDVAVVQHTDVVPRLSNSGSSVVGFAGPRPVGSIEAEIEWSADRDDPALLAALHATRGLAQPETHAFVEHCDWSLASVVMLHRPGQIRLLDVQLPALAADTTRGTWIRLQDRYSWSPGQVVELVDCDLPAEFLVWGGGEIRLDGCTGPVEGPWIRWLPQGERLDPLTVVHNGVVHTLVEAGTWRPQ